jgi:hypothetical protein
LPKEEMVAKASLFGKVIVKKDINVMEVNHLYRAEDWSRTFSSNSLTKPTPCGCIGAHGAT